MNLHLYLKSTCKSIAICYLHNIYLEQSFVFFAYYLSHRIPLTYDSSTRVFLSLIISVIIDP